MKEKLIFVWLSLRLIVMFLCASILCDIAKSLVYIRSDIRMIADSEQAPVDHTKELTNLRRTLERMMLSDDWNWNK